MGAKNLQSARKRLWVLARSQHWVITRAQLLDLGFSTKAIRRRLESGRLHRIYEGVYAVGRPHLDRRGEWMAAVLASGPGAAASHQTALAVWGIRAERGSRIHVSVPGARAPSRRGIAVHRRAAVDATRRNGIPVTTVACTLVDVAPGLAREQLEAAINEADILGLTDPERLRSELERYPGRRGVRILRNLLDRRTFRLTRSKLERMFIPIALRAGLPRPLTRVYVNGFEVDFYWPGLELVVETDGLTYHRTPAQQAAGLVRDQRHSTTEVTPLRFTHAQVAFEPRHVERTLAAVARRLRSPRAPS